MVHRFAFAVAMTAAAAVAQFRPVSCEFAPAFAVEGQPVTITVRCSRGMYLTSPSAFFDVHPGSQSAAAIPHVAAATPLVVTVGPWASHAHQWDLHDYTNNTSPVPVSAGTYWIHVTCSDATRALTYDEWFPLRVVPANQPPGSRAVTIEPTSGAFQIGTTTALRVSSPDDAGSIFQMFMSFDSRAPVELPGLVAFGISPPIYLWGAPVSFDLSGTASFRVILPNQPHIVDRGFVLQAQAVNLASGFPKASNCLPAIIKS